LDGGVAAFATAAAKSRQKTARKAFMRPHLIGPQTGVFGQDLSLKPL
jgi:hypothetical protein